MTRQKFGSIAIQRSDERRAEFMAELSLFDPSMLVWLDETGLDQQNTILAYGYSFIRHQLEVGGNSK